MSGLRILVPVKRVIDYAVRSPISSRLKFRITSVIPTSLPIGLEKPMLGKGYGIDIMLTYI